MHQPETSLFDTLRWRDPLSGRPLEPLISARTPSGVPVTGAMRIQGTNTGYPIVDCVVRLAPELAQRYKEWLRAYSLNPPARGNETTFQQTETVESFGWQWSWNSMMRTEADLRMRVLEKFKVGPGMFANQLVIDAGAGAGDQSKFMLSLGAAVVSVDLSPAIDVVAAKLRMFRNWVAIQADIMSLPFCGEQFDVIYCEGVLQHTQDSAKTVRELCRVIRPGGHILASHYVRPPAATAISKLKRTFTLGYYSYLRNRLSRMDRFRLLSLTGIIAAASYVPVIGFVLRKTGTAMYYQLMPDFKTTWTNTFDYYSNHKYQRFVEPDEFYDYFESSEMELIYKNVGAVVARKLNGTLTGNVRNVRRSF